MNAHLSDTKTVGKKIQAGKKLILAGDEKVLSKLPQGNWIGGTIPYFIEKEGGRFSQEEIYVTELPDYANDYRVKVYNHEHLQNVYLDAYDNGFSVIILPGNSDILSNFSLNSPKYPEFAVSPLVGWISGTHMEDLPAQIPKVYNGIKGEEFDDSAIVMHVSLPRTKCVEIDMLNIFEPGEGDTLRFPVDGFFAKDVIVNGKRENFAEYLRENKVDTKLPLVADIFGTRVNTSFQQVDENLVHFYAPVYAETEYHIARPFKDYVQEFSEKVPQGLGDKTFFSCNCILNYMYAELEGKKTNGFTGPVTFGEVAYQLMNQTMVYLTIEDN